MADDEEKDKSANQILQALDALSQTLHKARATRRSTSLPLPRSAKDDDDVVVDAAEDEVARPLPRRRLSPMSPLRSRAKLAKKEDDDDGDEEEGEDYDDSAPPKRQQQEFTAVKPEDVMVDGAAEKKGVTSWGATRVVSHIGMRRFGCVFSVEVVSAQGAPPSMNGLRLAVNVRRKEKRDGGDAADFDEALYVRCSLYNGANKPLGFVEPARQPFLLSVAVDGPELDLARRRSTVDLSQFAMEVTEKGQQWDMVFPLATAGKANKGGDLFVKLVFQSADVDGTYSQLAGEGKTIASSALSSFARKLRKSSLSNMLTPKMTRIKTPKLDVPAPDLQGIDSFMLDDPKSDHAPVAEGKEKEQEELEPEPEPTPVVEVKEEPQEEEPEREPADEPAPVAEVNEEEQKAPEPDAQDEDTELPVFDVIIDESVEGQEEKAELKEEADEEAKEESDEVASEEAMPSAVSDDVADAVEPVDTEAAGSEEASSVVDGDQVANELELEVLEEATPNDVPDAVADAVEPVEDEAAGSEEVSVVAGDEVANEVQTEALEEATPSDVSDAVADAAEPMEAEVAGSEEVSVVAGDEVANEPETEAVEVATPSDVSDTVADAVEVEPVDPGALESEEASVVAGDELAKEVDNELDTEPVESATPSCDDVSDAVAKEVEPVDAEAAGPEEVNGESQQVPEHGEDKDAATKPRRRRRFGWRMLALVVTPVAVMVSKNLNVVRF